MKRYEMHLTEKELNKLKKESKSSGLSVAEIIRRLIDEHFLKQNENIQV